MRAEGRRLGWSPAQCRRQRGSPINDGALVGGIVDKLGNLSQQWYADYMSNSITNPKYPNINVPLVGEDGNAMSILGRVKQIMRRNGLSDKWDEFYTEATSGDYDNLVITVMTWFAYDQQLSDDYEDEYEDA